MIVYLKFRPELLKELSLLLRLKRPVLCDILRLSPHIFVVRRNLKRVLPRRFAWRLACNCFHR